GRPQPRFAHAQGRQGPVQAVPPARPRQRGPEDAGRIRGGPACAGRGPAQSISLACLAQPERIRGSYPTNLFWARSSAGEHYVDIVGVAGSIPAAPTISGPDFAARAKGRLIWFGAVKHRRFAEVVPSRWAGTERPRPWCKAARHPEACPCLTVPDGS